MKPVQRKSYKNKVNITCESCTNCLYIKDGDMVCGLRQNYPYVYKNFCPTGKYMWCKGKEFVEK